MSGKQPEPIDVETFEPEFEITGTRCITFSVDSTRRLKTAGEFNLKRKVAPGTNQHHLSGRSSKEGPPLKRAHIEARLTPIASSSKQVVSTVRVVVPDLKRKQKSATPARPLALAPRTFDVIDLCSDSDEEMPPKGKRREVSPESDDETFHAGYMWTPLPEPEPEPITLPSLHTLTISTKPGPLRRVGHTPQGWAWSSANQASLTDSRPRIWDTIRTRGYQYSTARNTLFAEMRYNTLRPGHSFRKSSGPINKISQNSSVIAICSAAAEGHPDFAENGVSPYNKEGSLLLWQNGNVRTIHAHFETTTSQRYYSIEDVQFDPNDSSRFVTSGNDSKVCLWSYDKEFEGEDGTPVARLENTILLPGIPHDLHYQPGKSALAVACQDGMVYVYPTTDTLMTDEKIAFSAAPPSLLHSTGMSAWGCGPTENLLFTSSEPKRRSDYKGFHRAFDVSRGRQVYTFDVRESGDALAIDAEGGTMALFTQKSESLHLLRLYDIRTGNDRNPYAMVELEPLMDDGEVKCAMFSSDGVYLAVGRSDNAMHVYDARMLDAVVAKYEHSRLRGPGNSEYGIVEAQWVETRDRRKLGLLTGGNDGCVRLWDIRKASEDPSNGKVIAEANYGICHFSLGDPFRGERPLVVGDSGGSVHIFTGMGSTS